MVQTSLNFDTALRLWRCRLRTCNVTGPALRSNKDKTKERKTQGWHCDEL